MGAVLPRPDGTKSEAFLVHLGGGLGDAPAFGRKAKGVRIFADEAADYVEALLKRYRSQRRGSETFHDFVGSLSEEELTEFARWERR
jgi:sulfite reductase (ferredoxin)